MSIIPSNGNLKMMSLSSTTAGDRTPRSRFVRHFALLVAAIVMVTACSSGVVAPSSAPPAGGSEATPANGASGEGAAQSDPGVDLGSGTVSNANIAGPDGAPNGTDTIRESTG
jgi:hypothetical protein